MLDHERLFAQIDQRHLHLAAIVRIDRSWRIGHGDSMFDGEAGAGADLCLESDGDRHRKTRRRQRNLTRRKRDRLTSR